MLEITPGAISSPWSHGATGHRQFPEGSRVKLAITKVPPATPVPGLAEYRQMVSAARRTAPRSTWKTTAESMQALREGKDE